MRTVLIREKSEIESLLACVYDMSEVLLVTGRKWRDPLYEIEYCLVEYFKVLVVLESCCYNLAIDIYSGRKSFLGLNFPSSWSVDG